jgi:hypothetical protein
MQTMYAECPFCHAIFTLPTGLGQIPPKVRCGECGTVFSPQDGQENDSGHAPSTAESSAKETTSREAPPVSSPSVDNAFEDFLAGSRPELPEDDEPLPDLNSPSETQELEAVLSSYQATRTPKASTDNPYYSEEQDDQKDSMDLPLVEEEENLSESSLDISERFEDESDVDSVMEAAIVEIDGLPPIVEDLDDDTDSLESETASAQSTSDEVLDFRAASASDDITERFQSEEESEDNPEGIQLKDPSPSEDSDNDEHPFGSSFRNPETGEQDFSLTGEMRNFLDEIDSDPNELFGQQEPRSDYEQQLLNLDEPEAENEAENIEHVLEAADKENEGSPTDLLTGLDEKPTEKPQPAKATNAEAVKSTAGTEQPPLLAGSAFIPAPHASADSKKALPEWLYGLLGLGLILILSLQYLYFNRDQFAEYPNARPLLQGMCKLTGCTIAERRDLSQIELLNHGIFAHPAAENALIIKAVIRNRAPFPQPYPIIEITLNDFNSNRVALRRFSPGEYLLEIPQGDQLMPVNENIPVHLQVVDPGQEAMAFEFEFH